jgi:uncharacterized protein with ParB-like and HNH nuclease domain
VAGAYEKAITIMEAIDAINSRDYLLPAIQRKFVWSSQQISVLFDSIMRGYPINSFMMWEIKSGEIKNSYKFYEFLKGFCQRFNDENPHVATNASFKDFKAVIDGQQRLTSLYIGLCGTYAYKQPRVWWPNTKDDALLPPRKLYLDLLHHIKVDEDESLMKYNFKFLTESQFNESKEIRPAEHHWFCVHEILRMPKVDGGNHIWSKVVKPYLEQHGLQDNEFAQDTLSQLYDVIRVQKLIHYFNETNQEIDHVLDIFIRTNSGGTKLDFSDLLMSIAIANWDGDFRTEVDDLIKQIHQSDEMGFYLERDWILKTCLMLTGADIKFRVENFKSAQVGAIQSEWCWIKECIKSTFKLIRRFGINPQSLTSKNAVIPICYYLYKKKVNDIPLYGSINNLARHDEYRSNMSRWFYMALLKGVFGGQADAILSSMREVLDKNINDEVFPLAQIVGRYQATNKDLRFDDAYIESLLDTQYGEGRCRALLHLLFPEMNPTEIFHIDHLHPKVVFEKKNLKQFDFLRDNPELMEFFADARHWNSVANLHLLNDSQNLSKKDKPLKTWLEDPAIHLDAVSLLTTEASLEFEAFRGFYSKRRNALRARLISRVYMTTSLSIEPTNDDFDEEVVEESKA